MNAMSPAELRLLYKIAAGLGALDVTMTLTAIALWQTDASLFAWAAAAMALGALLLVALFLIGCFLIALFSLSDPHVSLRASGVALGLSAVVAGVGTTFPGTASISILMFACSIGVAVVAGASVLWRRLASGQRSTLP